jgi:hypothetical protein
MLLLQTLATPRLATTHALTLGIAIDAASTAWPGERRRTSLGLTVGLQVRSGPIETVRRTLALAIDATATARAGESHAVALPIEIGTDVIRGPIEIVRRSLALSVGATGTAKTGTIHRATLGIAMRWIIYRPGPA